MGNSGDLMERVYRVFPWREDPESFKRRVEEGVGLFESLLGHEWLQRLTRKGRVRVLDVMGGTGVGGVSLALALGKRGVEAEVTVLDVRESALAKAREYSREVLGAEVSTVRARVEDLPGVVECPFDVILMYGLSAPHLDPYQFVRAAAGMAACLSRDGVAVLDEGDRVYGIFYLMGYKHVLPEEASEERLVVGYHAGYDPYRGVFKRLLVDHFSGERVLADMRLWDIAGLAGILWAFFGDVDFHPLGRPTRGFILARNPRPVDPGAYSKPPRIALKPASW